VKSTVASTRSMLRWWLPNRKSSSVSRYASPSPIQCG